MACGGQLGIWYYTIPFIVVEWSEPKAKKSAQSCQCWEILILSEKTKDGHIVTLESWFFLIALIFPTLSLLSPDLLTALPCAWSRTLGIFFCNMIQYFTEVILVLIFQDSYLFLISPLLHYCFSKNMGELMFFMKMEMHTYLLTYCVLLRFTLHFNANAFLSSHTYLHTFHEILWISLKIEFRTSTRGES